MKNKPVLTTVLILVLAAAGFWIYRSVTKEEPSPYRFAALERGNLESAVSATGALSAVTTVQVGTQVSGQIEAIFADFNDRVKKGQLIARIDPTLQHQAVQDAEARLELARADLERTSAEYERNRRLFESKVLTEIEFNTAKYAYASAQANAKSAEVALKRAKQNLEYTSIYSPIDGVVVERNVDVGQTVAASYATPQLFLIAQDLSQMQILASVDESDIGLIKNEQPVRFTVQAYPDESFQGVVKQVRLQSKTQENVVNYTVAIGVQNRADKLLPGMTATVEFLTGAVRNAMTVPNAALRFRPPQEALEKMRTQRRGNVAAAANGQVRPQGAAGAPGDFAPRSGRSGNNAARPTDRGTLWTVDAKGELLPIRVRTGITDGQRTQVSGTNLKEGMKVVIGLVQAQVSTGNPFQPNPQRGGGGRRGP